MSELNEQLSEVGFFLVDLKRMINVLNLWTNEYIFPK